MTREDLFYAMGMVEEKRLTRCESLRNPSRAVPLEEENMQNGKYQVNHRRRKNLWLIAAVVALGALLMGSAIAALVTMDVDTVRVHGADGRLHHGEKVRFEEVREDVYIELGCYYPQQIPAGYTLTFVSDVIPGQNQSLDYENEAGNTISFWIFAGDPASHVEIFDIVSKEDVTIGDCQGILYTQEGNKRALVWADTEQGYGFALRSDDMAADLVAMAESTGAGEYLVPSRSESTKKAIAELGDLTPAYLPAGYAEQNTMGSPLEEGGGWYSYVRKWFVNREENKQIYLEYETYRIMMEEGYTDDARTICALFLPDCNVLEDIITGEEIEVGGMYGLMAENHVTWADPETHVVYHLYSEAVSQEELLQVAQSIYADT